MRKADLLLGLLCGLAMYGFAGTQEISDNALSSVPKLDRAGLTKGICVVLGADPPEFSLDAIRTSGFLVHVLESRKEGVEMLRVAAAGQDIDPRRFLIDALPLEPLPYAENMIDLIVIPSFFPKVSSDEIARVLRPRGMLLVNAASMNDFAFTQWIGNAALVVQDRAEGWLRLKKPPLKGADDWSHWEHGPDNNPVSLDTNVHAPFRTQWLAQPYYIAMPAVTTAAAGRTFLAMGHIAHHEREEPWLNTLLARNGYNGVELWRRELPDGYMVHRSAFIASEEAFYMIDPGGEGCLLLDPETGAEKDRIRLDGISGQWKWMVRDGNTLFVLIGKERDPRETTVVRSNVPAWSWNELSPGYYTERVPWGFGETIAAFDLHRKRILWTYREKASVDSRAMAVADHKVFFYVPDARLGALDAATGKPVWTNDDPEVRRYIEEPGQGLSSTPGFRSTCFCVYTPQALIFAPQTNMNVVAVSASDGRLLWHRPKTSSNPNALYLDETLYIGIGPDGNTLALDPFTGDTRKDLGFRKRSCARLTATAESLFCRGYPEGITRFDRKSQQFFFDGSMRPACNDGVLGANGLLYVGPWLCDCNLSLMGSVAWTSANGFQPESVQGERVFGPGDPVSVKSSAFLKDWSTYRADKDHSGSTKASVSPVLFPLWTWKSSFPQTVTAPTAADNLVFVAGEEGIVRVLSADTGLLQWTFAASGPITQPPTLWKSRAYFGAGDGYVYALEAATGKLLWKFRAAPMERRIMMYGALCSTWPVNSGVLVDKGVAYFAAGLVDYDGTYVYAVHAETGEKLWVNNTTGHLDKVLRKGVSVQGNLVIFGDFLWMAGGNVVSPASYRLDSGTYAGLMPKDGTPETNRGEELGVFLNQGLILGGRLRYSAQDNAVNPGQFIAAKVESSNILSGTTFSSGQVAPVWDEKLLVALPGRESVPAAYDSQAVTDWFTAATRTFTERRWDVQNMEGNRVDALALAQDAVVAVCRTPVRRSLRPEYHLCLFHRDTGELIFQEELPGPPRLNGLAIDRRGRVFVSLADGGIAAFGGLENLRASVMGLAESSRDGKVDATELTERLREALDKVHNSEGRNFLLASLQEQGIDLPAQARQNGVITHWRLLGPVPWDAVDSPTDKVLIGEPEVRLDASYTVDGKNLSWRDYVTADVHGEVDLAGIFGRHESAAVYAYAKVHLPVDGEYRLSIGSNDGFKCWFNGQEVARSDKGRLYVPDQDSVLVPGKAGVNPILIKITQFGGAWAFSVRVMDAHGNAVDPRV